MKRLLLAPYEITSKNTCFLAFFLYLRKYAYIGSNLLLIGLLLAYLGLFPQKTFTKGLTIMQIPDEMLKEIRESGYDQELVFTQIRKLLDSEKPIKENEYNLELIDNYLLDKDPQELSKNAAEIVMAAELIDNYLLDKRFMRELEDEEYDAA